MLDVGDDAGEHGVKGVVDGREDFTAAEHPSRAALCHKDAARCQLWLHHIPVEVLRVELQPHSPHLSIPGLP